MNRVATRLLDPQLQYKTKILEIGLWEVPELPLKSFDRNR